MKEQLKILKETYSLAADCQKELEKYIRTPICVANCGKCCEINNIGINTIEGEYLAQWLLKQKPDFREHVLDKCQAWMIEIPQEEDKDVLIVKGGIGIGLLQNEGIDRIMHEVMWLVNRTECPMLEDNKCLIHPARPLVCRQYGVTRVTGDSKICQRPIGQHETEALRCYITEEHPVSKQIAANVEKMETYLKSTKFDKAFFIPTYLMMRLRPMELYEMIYFNDIPTAKLSMLTGTSIDWQSQIYEYEAVEEEIGALVDPFQWAIGDR